MFQWLISSRTLFYQKQVCAVKGKYVTNFLLKNKFEFEIVTTKRDALISNVIDVETLVLEFEPGC